MPLKDQIKNFTRKLVENKPGADALTDMVHHCKVTLFSSKMMVCP